MDIKKDEVCPYIRVDDKYIYCAYREYYEQDWYEIIKFNELHKVKQYFTENTQPTFNPTPTMSLSQKINEMYFTEEVTQDAANTVKQLKEFKATLSQLWDSVRNFESKVDLCQRRITSEYDRKDPVEFETYLKLAKDPLKVLAKHDYIKTWAKLTKEDKGIDVNDYLS